MINIHAQQTLTQLRRQAVNYGLPDEEARELLDRVTAGFEKYGCMAHLRAGHERACHKCGGDIECLAGLAQRPGGGNRRLFCPHCRAEVGPYCVVREAREELLDALAQGVFAIIRGDWPEDRLTHEYLSGVVRLLELLRARGVGAG